MSKPTAWMRSIRRLRLTKIWRVLGTSRPGPRGRARRARTAGSFQEAPVSALGALGLIGREDGTAAGLSGTLLAPRGRGTLAPDGEARPGELRGASSPGEGPRGEVAAPGGRARPPGRRPRRGAASQAGGALPRLWPSPAAPRRPVPGVRGAAGPLTLRHGAGAAFTPRAFPEVSRPAHGRWPPPW